jgi:DNA topoisomerase-6 subunit B
VGIFPAVSPLVGFDNSRKALLTTVKEAVDNSLDACEEAGIVKNRFSSSSANSSTARNFTASE